MKLLCVLVGHDPRGRRIDTGFHESARCRRCGAVLERAENGKWTAVESERA